MYSSHFAGCKAWGAYYLKQDSDRAVLCFAWTHPRPRQRLWKALTQGWGLKGAQSLLTPGLCSGDGMRKGWGRGAFCHFTTQLLTWWQVRQSGTKLKPWHRMGREEGRAPDGSGAARPSGCVSGSTRPAPQPPLPRRQYLKEQLVKNLFPHSGL